MSTTSIWGGAIWWTLTKWLSNVTQGHRKCHGSTERI